MSVSLEGFPEDIVLPHDWVNEENDARFSGVHVEDPVDGDLWLKAVNHPEDRIQREFLMNSVVWVFEMGRRLPDDVQWIVTTFNNAADHGEWALFNYIDGQPASEEYLGFWSLGMVEIMSDMIRMPYDVDGEVNDVGDWCKTRLVDRTDVLDSSFFDDDDRTGFHLILENANFGVLRPGIIHGDLRLENILVVEGDDGELTAVLNDAEFGTDFDRTNWDGQRIRSEWDKPRLHDAAQWFNLLNTQYHSPELADEFLEELTKELRDLDDFDEEQFRNEFFLSVLERTVSMMQHYILTEGKVADDPRRLVAGPYVATIRRTLSELEAA